jgi:N-acylneuraminate cytidylyltransferase
MQVLAVIPARGGSKGIRRKNVRRLCGQPLIGWTIQAARAAQHVDRVVVSTDDPEIAAVARRYEAEVVWRPAEISGDLASSEDALLHTLQHLRSTEQYAPDLLVFLQCTSPLTHAEDIDGVVQALLADQADTALAVSDFHYFLWRREGRGNLVGVNHDKSQRLLRQQREPNYLECGSVYAMRAAEFGHRKHRFFGRTTHFEVPAERCWEIDEPVDLEVAEVLMRSQLRQAQLASIPQDLQAVVFDFDGVLTDNRVLVDQYGQEAVRCSRADGMGIAQLRHQQVHMLVLSSEANPVVTARCEKLGLQCLSGVRRKWPVLADWLQHRGITPDRVAYVGNDHNDLDCLRRVGCAVAVADAHPDVKSAAHLVLTAAGGQGAVREFTDLVFKRLGETPRVEAA